MKTTGILLANIGTPDTPTPAAVKKYLNEFLSDPRVVELPKILWQPLLQGLILQTRPKKSAALYQKIWSEKGSPLLVYSREIAQKLENAFRTKLQTDIYVTLGMRYGNPSIKAGLEELKAKNVERIVVLPLYPQYSATSTASVFDEVATVLKKWRALPEIRTINHYYDNPIYIEAIADSIREYQHRNGKAHLLFSFHSIPQSYADQGDPYALQCEQSAKSIAQALNLAENEYTISFQSRLGYSKWLQPYTDKVLRKLPKQGIKDIQVVCPGFAVDCLETLEEIAIRGKEQFLAAGGKSYHYIPALNSSNNQIELLLSILFSYM